MAAEPHPFIHPLRRTACALVLLSLPTGSRFCISFALKSTQTEPGADRGPQTGSPAGVVVPDPTCNTQSVQCASFVMNIATYTTASVAREFVIKPPAGRYRSRFRICAGVRKFVFTRAGNQAPDDLCRHTCRCELRLCES